MRGLRAIKVFATALLIAEALILVSALSITTLPRICGIQPYSVLTGSMSPAMPVGAMTFVDSGVSGDDVKNGDIVAFSIDTVDEHVVTHRVIDNNELERSLKTKGDANAISDPMMVGYDQVIGKAMMTVPYLGFAIMWVTQHKVALIAIAGMLFTVIIAASRTVSQTTIVLERIETKGELCKKAQLQER